MGSAAWKRAIKCWISWSWARRIRGESSLGWVGAFFNADIQFGAGLLDDLLSVLLGELLVFVVSLDGMLDLRDFVLGQVAAAVSAILPGVQAVIGAVRSLTDNGEGTVLHALDLKDLFDETLGCQRCIHGPSIDAYLY